MQVRLPPAWRRCAIAERNISDVSGDSANPLLVQHAKCHRTSAIQPGTNQHVRTPYELVPQALTDTLRHKLIQSNTPPRALENR